MKAKLFRLIPVLLFLIIANESVIAQSLTTTDYTVTNIKDTIRLAEKGYYIAEVNDLRFNKHNIGSINMKAGKLSILTPDSLHIFIYNGIVPHETRDTSLKPLIINIEKLKSFASTNGNIDDAELFIKINAQIPSSTGPKTIYTFERLFTFKKKHKDDFLTTLLVTALRTSLDKLPSGKNTNLQSVNILKLDKPVNLPQSKPGSEVNYIIPLPDNNISLNDLKINKIEDQRTNKDNVGNVYLGYFNRNGKSDLDSGLIKYLTKIVKVDSTPNIKTIKLIINKLECIENLTNNGEQAKFLLLAQIVSDSINSRTIIYQGKVESDTIIDADITQLWPSVIAKGFQKYFENYDAKKNNPGPTQLMQSKLSGEIITEKILAKRYYVNNNEIKTISGFRHTFYNTSDDSLKRMYKSSKACIRTGRVLIVTGAALFAYPLIGYLLSEEKKIKKWYNEEGPNIVSPAYLGGKKTLVPLSVGIFAAGFIIKWIGKGILTQSISRYNKSLIDKVSLDLNPNLNGSGYTFKLGILLSQK